MARVRKHRGIVRLGLLVSIMGLVVALGVVAPVAAATYTVDDPGDANDLTGADGVCDTVAGPTVRCTLRAAVQQSNFTGPDDLIVFKKNLGTIFIDDDIDISDGVIIRGDCKKKQRINGFSSDNGLFEIFGGVITFECLILEEGDDDTGDGGCVDIDPDVISVLVKNVEFDSCQAQDGNGGGIENGSDLLRVQASKFTNNFANNDGGGIYTDPDNSLFARTLVSKGTIFRGNRAGDDGGAMANQGDDSQQNITETTFRENQADDGGGAVAHQGDDDSQTSITNSRFIENIANRGGAFCDVSGDGNVFVDVFGGNTFIDNFGGLNPPFQNDFCS